jgi:GNAT superfamily N-acetyltransferase
MTTEREGYHLTDEPFRLDRPAIAALVQTAYWAADRSVEQIVESLAHSTCLALTHEGATVGFVRALSDYSVNSYICDFIIAPEHRGRGLGKWMLETLMALPTLARTSQLLVTEDAMSFYEAYGFAQHPYTCMKRPRQIPA